MGFMDKLGNLFGDSKPGITDSVKPAGQVLRENGIDTSSLKFKYNQGGSVEVSGTTTSQAECDRICELIKEMPTTSEVHNKLTIGVPEPAPVPEVVAEPELTPEPEAAQEEEKGGTYTVQKVYGTVGKYYQVLGADNLPLPAPKPDANRRIVFSPDVRRITDPTASWDTGHGSVALPGLLPQYR